MIRTQGLTHLHLAVRDVAKSLAFYQAAFGMKVQFWEGKHMVFLHTPGSRDLITLRQAKRGEPVGPAGVAHFGFRLTQNSDLDAAITHAVSVGATLLERGEHSPGHPYAYIADPDGYKIEL